MKYGGLLLGLIVLALIGCGGGGGGGGTGTSSSGSSSSGSTGGGSQPGRRVVGDGTDAGIPGVIVQYFSAAGQLILQDTSDGGGYFRNTVPETARAFNLVQSSIPAGFYNYTFSYGGKFYDPTQSTCRAPLPGITLGPTTPFPLGDVRLFYQSGPPPLPYPSGCQ